METYGFPESRWASAKEEARQEMINVAAANSTISYSELVTKIRSIKFDAHDFNLFHLLGQVSKAEYEKGRGLLTAVVVRQSDGLPGDGFFDLAKELGFSVDDRDAFWINQVREVYDDWGPNEPERRRSEMNEEVYSILLNIRVVQPEHGRRGYMISAWPGAVATRAGEKEFYPFNYKKDAFMQDLGSMVFEIIRSQVGADDTWKA